MVLDPNDVPRGTLWSSAGGGLIGISELIYLPLITNNYLYAPDLVVRDIVTGSDGLKVVIENQGNAPVTNEFWVDAYVNPYRAPTAVNQIWNYLTDQGLVWGYQVHCRCHQAQS